MNPSKAAGVEANANIYTALVFLTLSFVTPSQDL